MNALSDMLAVGMVANGGEVAQIMAEIAQRRRQLPGWEAFHYEKISDDAVELTGGMVSIAHGQKRWLEPHDCVTIPLSAVVEEMQRRGLLATSTLDDTAEASTWVAPSGFGAANFLHVKFELPSDPDARLRILQTLHLDAKLLGAKVVACHLASE